MLFITETQADKVAFIVCIILIICIILILSLISIILNVFTILQNHSSSKETVVKKISRLNKKLVNLIDDIFWTMGFKTETQAKKVVPITHNTPIIFKYIHYITCSNSFLKAGPILSVHASAVQYRDSGRQGFIHFMHYSHVSYINYFN